MFWSTKVAFAAEDIHDAEYVSKLLGTRTQRIISGSSSNQTQGYSKSRTYNYQAIPLLRPDKFMQMSQNKSLIMRTGYFPINTNQFIWYKHNKMRHLVLSDPQEIFSLYLPCFMPESTTHLAYVLKV